MARWRNPSLGRGVLEGKKTFCVCFHRKSCIREAPERCSFHQHLSGLCLCKALIYFASSSQGETRQKEKGRLIQPEEKPASSVLSSLSLSPSKAGGESRGTPRGTVEPTLGCPGAGEMNPGCRDGARAGRVGRGRWREPHDHRPGQGARNARSRRLWPVTPGWDQRARVEQTSPPPPAAAAQGPHAGPGGEIAGPRRPGTHDRAGPPPNRGHPGAEGQCPAASGSLPAGTGLLERKGDNTHVCWQPGPFPLSPNTRPVTLQLGVRMEGWELKGWLWWPQPSFRSHAHVL